jgi:hypothetical protein
MGDGRSTCEPRASPTSLSGAARVAVHDLCALTIGGIALLAFGLLAGDFRPWLGWVTLGADAIFLAGYLYVRDIPPFVFYLLFTAVGLAVL